MYIYGGTVDNNVRSGEIYRFQVSSSVMQWNLILSYTAWFVIISSCHIHFHMQYCIYIEYIVMVKACALQSHFNNVYVTNGGSQVAVTPTHPTPSGRNCCRPHLTGTRQYIRIHILISACSFHVCV